jgi:hypothetical protein
VQAAAAGAPPQMAASSPARAAAGSPAQVAASSPARAAAGSPARVAASSLAQVAGDSSAPQAGSRSSRDTSTESSQPAMTASATPVNDGTITYAAETSPSGGPRLAGDAAQGRPRESWPSPLWGTPVDLPTTIELAPATRDTDRRAAAAPPPGSIAWPAEPGPASTARSHQNRHTKDSDLSMTPGAPKTADPDRSWTPAAVRELVPPTASAPPSSARPDPEPGDALQKPRVPGRRPQVSIGTIDVTVVPPAPPAPAAAEIRPPVQAAPTWSRPPSLLAADPGASRMRDGLRRWYGTAQV